LRCAPASIGREDRRIACPLLLVVCDEDAITPPVPAADAAGRAPRGELLRLSGGHYAVYEGVGFERAVTAQIAFLNRSVANPSLVAGVGAART